MDTKFSFAIRFPFNPANVELDTLEIPEIYNNLNTMLKRL